MLDREIESARLSNRAAGYSVWALIGALAGIAVFATALWSAAAKNQESTELLLWIILLSTVVDYGPALLGSSSTSRFGPIEIRFRLGTYFGTRRDVFALTLSRSLLITILAYGSRHDVGFYAWISVVVVYGLAALALLVLLFGSFLHFPVWSIEPEGYQHPWKWFSRAATAVFIFLPLLALIGYARAISTPLLGDSLWALQLAACVVAFSNIVVAIASVQKPSSLLGDLLFIRRETLLGRLAPTDAAKQFDTAVSGLTATDVLREKMIAMRACLRECADAVSSTAILLGHYRQLGAKTKGRRQEPSVAEDIEELDRVQGRLSTALNDAVRQVKSVENCLLQLTIATKAVQLFGLTHGAVAEALDTVSLAESTLKSSKSFIKNAQVSLSAG